VSQGRRADAGPRTGKVITEPLLVLAVAAVAGAALALVSYTLGYRARPDLCVAVGLAAGLTWRLSRLVVPPQEPPLEPPAEEPDDDARLLLTSLESRLSWASDPDRFRERLRPELVGLATDLLRTRRGVDPRTQPEHARTILGDPLWQLMTGRPERTPSRAELARMVEAMERI
jgi:hypothetical protein